ncbi:hypothetical protein JTF06_04885 [Desemzia sp. RIT804]|uniref:YqgU-like beta propeller domain-containing protein n=1 Tax=Desemzia sp. RIT 804 TaxID=2810209 RepID=UPI00194FB3A6|nr:hypothetical protein [Desemzia sp. RIT 804]MBM6614221.1 hypothetical protein [Desemzia sp. RIT 804]
MIRLTTSKISVLLLIVALFLGACRSKEETPTQGDETEEGIVFTQIPLPKEEFRKIIGWKSEEEVIVQAGDLDGDSLYSFNILTGSLDMLYETDSFILASIVIVEEEKMIVQQVKDAKSTLVVLNNEGDTIQELPINANGFVDINVNSQNPAVAFVSYYEGENNTAVYNWNIETNEYTTVESASLNPQWYSENLYLFVDNGEDFTLGTGELYMGDIRNDEVLLLDSYVSDFFLHEDTFIKFTPSDFNDQEIILTYQYPFLVDVGFMVAPKVTMNKRILFPHITQAERNTSIYGIFAEKAVSIEEEPGEFIFAQLDFEEGKIEPIIEVPEEAPILISKNGQYCLYGWSFELLIDIENQTIHELIAL